MRLDADEAASVALTQAHCLRVTRTALVITCAELVGEQVIAQSEIAEDSDVWRAGQRGTLRISRWLAARLGVPGMAPPPGPTGLGPSRPGPARAAAPREKCPA